MSTTRTDGKSDPYGLPAATDLAEATDAAPMYWLDSAHTMGATPLYHIHEAVSGEQRILACDAYRKDAERIIDALRWYAAEFGVNPR